MFIFNKYQSFATTVDELTPFIGENNNRRLKTVALETALLAINADNKLIRCIGEKNSRKFKAAILEIALSALTISSNIESYSPLKYYQTSYFVETVTDALESSADEDAAYTHDKLLYHALLYSISKTFFFYTPLNDERVLSILATPTFINFVSSQAWFQKLKKECLKIGLKTSFAEVIDYAKDQVKQYLEANFLNPILQLIAEDKAVLLKNFQDSCLEFVAERCEIANEITQDAKQTYAHIVKNRWNLLQPHQLEATINQIQSTTHKIHHLTSMPRITIVKHQTLKSRSPVSLYLKTYTAWTLLANSQPALAPVLFSSPCSDAVDIAIRLAGMTAVYVTGHSFLSTVATEVVSQSIPNKFRRFSANERLSELTHQVSSWIIRNLDVLKYAFKESAERDGISHAMLKTMDKVIAQAFAGMLYSISTPNSHPLATALSACTFIEYLGIVGDHYHLVELSNVSSQTPYLDKVPYYMITGLAFTAAEIGTSWPRALTSLTCTLVNIPTIVDNVVITDFYQNRILIPLKEILNPNYSLQRWAKVSSKAAVFANSIGLGSTLTKYTKIIADTTQLALMAKSGYQILKHPVVQQAGTAVAIMTAAVMSIYMKSIFCSTVSSYLGTGIGAITNVIHKPKDIVALSAVSAGAVVGILTQSPLQATATTEIIDVAFRTPRGRNCCKRINELFFAAIPKVKKVGRSLHAGVKLPLSVFNYIKQKLS